MKDDTYPQSFLDQLPSYNLELELSMQQNEMFILEMEGDDIKIAIESRDYRTISEHLYRVQKLGSNDYTFRHHLETNLINSDISKMSKRYFRVQSLKTLFSLKPFKVKIDYLGNIRTLQ